MNDRLGKLLLTLLFAGAFALPGVAGARTLGTGGQLGDVDLVNKTIEVGRYTLKVTPRTILRDSHGHEITLRELENQSGYAGVRITGHRGGYVVQVLEMLGGEDDDSPEIQAEPTKATAPTGRRPSPAKRGRR